MNLGNITSLARIAGEAKIRVRVLPEHETPFGFGVPARPNRIVVLSPPVFPMQLLLFSFFLALALHKGVDEVARDVLLSSLPSSRQSVSDSSQRLAMGSERDQLQCPVCEEVMVKAAPQAPRLLRV